MRSLPLDEIRNEDRVQPDRSWLLENLGFLTSKHEINVGITRSKFGLIIVGKSLPNWILISCGVSFPSVVSCTLPLSIHRKQNLTKI